MPSLTQAVSSVGSFALVIIVGMVWWWTDLDTKSKAEHKAYLDTSEKVESVRLRLREVREKVRELKTEKRELEGDRETADGQLGNEGDRIEALAASVEALTDRADVLRQVLTWLSYSLVPFDEQRPDEQLKALGGDLDGNRILLEKLVQKGEVLFINGFAAAKEDVEAFRKRLAACGYLADPSVIRTYLKTNPAGTKNYVAFELSAELRAPPVPEIQRL